MNTPPLEESSEWYEVIESSDLMQGDILMGCPVFLPPRDLTPDVLDEGKPVDFLRGSQDVVIMSQSSDLVAGQKSAIWLVMLCPIWSLSQVEKSDQIMQSAYGKEDCRRGNRPGLHMIAGCNDADRHFDVSVVSFHDSISLPLGFLRSFVERQGKRVRMNSPYREHLAQAFARYFMRVGLPVRIPPFKSADEERKLLRQLENMDPAKRKEIFSRFPDI